MIEVINLEKLSNDGYKQPANDPNESTPDNITHCQLRYNTFTSSYVIQGVAVTGSSSTFEFDITGITYTLFKLYVSTDGTTYTEKKSYGGSLGKTLNETTANAVLTTGNQTVAGIKTFSSVPIISTTATTSTQAVNKLFVDTRVGIKQWKGYILQSGSNSLAFGSEYINTTGATVTGSRDSTGYYLMTFSTAWMGLAGNAKLLIEYTPFQLVSLGQSSADKFISISQYFEDPLADTTIEIYNHSNPARTTLVDTFSSLLLTITLFP